MALPGDRDIAATPTALRIKYDDLPAWRRYLWLNRRIIADVSARLCFHYNRFF
jgi:hypothetical protein